MARLPHARGEGQAPARTLDVTNPRSVFVWITEARETMDELAAVAADSLRPRRRRHLTRRAAEARYRHARAALTWLLSVPLGAPADPAAGVQSATPGPFERWAE